MPPRDGGRDSFAASSSAQDRPPNFRGDDGRLYLVRCFVCDPEHGKENHASAVAAGTCAWCGWKEAE